MAKSMSRIAHCAPRRAHGLAAALIAALAATAPIARAQGEPAAVSAPVPRIVLGTIVPETRFVGRWYGLIYEEAFRRLGMTVRMVLYPTQRLSVSADQGLVDGETARVSDYQADHPALVRVEEPLVEAVFALFAVDPAVAVTRLPDLPAAPWRGVYLRGVAVCAKSLAPWLPAARLTDVGDVTQAWEMVLSSRADFVCTSDLSVTDIFSSPEFKGRAEVRKLFDLANTPLHTYLHRRHAALAPRLAEVLKQMKAEGAIERFRREALDAAGR